MDWAMPIPWNLHALVKGCRQGDADSWHRLVDSFQSLVYSIAVRHGLDAEDAADVFQTTFQALHANLDKVREDSTLPKWLAVTASRECLRIIRTRKRTTPLEDSGLQELLASEDQAADASAIENVRAATLRKVLETMGSRCRDLLTLLYLEDLPYEAVREKTGMAAGAIGPTRARCLEKLRVLLLECEFFG